MMNEGDNMASEEGSRSVAIFGPNSGSAFSGHPLLHRDGQFSIEGVGDVDANQVAQYEREGLLIWSDTSIRNELAIPQPVEAVPEDKSLVLASTQAPAGRTNHLAIALIALAVLIAVAVAVVYLSQSNAASHNATTYDVKTDSQGGTQLVPVAGNPYEPGSTYADNWDSIKYGTPDENQRLQDWADKNLGQHFEIDDATNLLVVVSKDGSRSLVRP
jgi:hypothetical protein